MKDGMVCACSAEGCDDHVEAVGDLPPDRVVVYQTSKAGDRLVRTETAFTDKAADVWHRIELSPSELFQEIVGFGGAVTDAAAINIGSLTPVAQSQLLDAYYSDSGLEYSLGRVNMASCDFSNHSYSYAEVPGDYEMESFSIEEDRRLKLPLLRGALQRSPGLRIFASPWSAPAWLKTNNKLVDGHLKSDERSQGAYALYFSRFLDAYKAEGVDVWGVTVQNEPHGWATPIWESTFYTPEEQRDFVKKHLGPRLRSDHPGVKIIIHDDQRLTLPKRVEPILGDDAAARYIDGIGVHWYTGVDGLVQDYWRLARTHDLAPDKFILGTEACNGFIFKGPRPGSWHRAHAYAMDIIRDLQNHVSGWTDWNIALDMDGGPNHAGNLVDSPILVDTADPQHTTFYKNPMYYYLGHFSKFFRPGGRRIGVLSRGPAAVETTAVRNVDGTIAVVVMNRDYIFGRRIAIHDPERGYINTYIPPASIQTYIYRAGAPGHTVI